jgi:hypothetical protein
MHWLVLFGEIADVRIPHHSKKPACPHSTQKGTGGKGK